MVSAVNQKFETGKGEASWSAPQTETSRVTVDCYEGRAEAFWQGTRDHDVSQNREALLAAIGRPAPLRILEGIGHSSWVLTQQPSMAVMLNTQGSRVAGTHFRIKRVGYHQTTGLAECPRYLVRLLVGLHLDLKKIAADRSNGIPLSYQSSSANSMAWPTTAN